MKTGTMAVMNGLKRYNSQHREQPRNEKAHVLAKMRRGFGKKRTNVNVMKT